MYPIWREIKSHGLMDISAIHKMHSERIIGSLA
jgi:hypothetical protein